MVVPRVVNLKGNQGTPTVSFAIWGLPYAGVIFIERKPTRGDDLWKYADESGWQMLAVQNRYSLRAYLPVTRSVRPKSCLAPCVQHLEHFDDPRFGRWSFKPAAKTARFGAWVTRAFFASTPCEEQDRRTACCCQRGIVSILSQVAVSIGQIEREPLLKKQVLDVRKKAGSIQRS